MPIYEYQCINCGKKFELLRKLSDKDSEIECPSCNKVGVKRVLSTFATISSNISCATTSYSSST